MPKNAEKRFNGSLYLIVLKVFILSILSGIIKIEIASRPNKKMNKNPTNGHPAKRFKQIHIIKKTSPPKIAKYVRL